jgi:hypothetical protein
MGVSVNALPNSAIDGDTVRSPLRARHGARHRERQSQKEDT